MVLHNKSLHRNATSWAVEFASYLHPVSLVVRPSACTLSLMGVNVIPGSVNQHLTRVLEWLLHLLGLGSQLPQWGHYRTVAKPL
jgi:hypothetical protein